VINDSKVSDSLISQLEHQLELKKRVAQVCKKLHITYGTALGVVISVLIVVIRDESIRLFLRQLLREIVGS